MKLISYVENIDKLNHLRFGFHCWVCPEIRWNSLFRPTQCFRCISSTGQVTGRLCCSICNLCNQKLLVGDCPHVLKSHLDDAEILFGKVDEFCEIASEILVGFLILSKVENLLQLANEYLEMVRLCDFNEIVLVFELPEYCNLIHARFCGNPFGCGLCEAFLLNDVKCCPYDFLLGVVKFNLHNKLYQLLNIYIYLKKVMV